MTLNLWWEKSTFQSLRMARKHIRRFELAVESGAQKAVLICVLSCRHSWLIINNLERLHEDNDSLDSIAAFAKDQSNNSEYHKDQSNNSGDLIVLNSRALLPCFRFIYKSFKKYPHKKVKKICGVLSQMHCTILSVENSNITINVCCSIS